MKQKKQKANLKNKKRNLTPYEINLLIKTKTPLEQIQNHPIDYPIEYITKKAIFQNSLFFVNENVLIPRIETEDILKIALKEIKMLNKNKIEFIDVGTGSGCIGISLILELINKKINFIAHLVDISKKTLRITKKNVKNLIKKKELYSKIRIYQSNLLENIPKNTKFDFIIANLPYVPTNRTLNNSTKYEPKIALYSKENGLYLIKKLLQQSFSKLTNNGIVILEIDEIHTIKDFSNFHKHFSQIYIQKDSFNKNRFIVLKK